MMLLFIFHLPLSLPWSLPRWERDTCGVSDAYYTLPCCSFKSTVLHVLYCSYSPDVYQEGKETPMESLMPTIPHHAAPLNLQFSMHHAAHTPAAFFHFAPALITPLMSRKKSFSVFPTTYCWSYQFWRNQICYWSWLWFTDWKEDTVGFVSNKDVQFARVILLQLLTRIIIVQDIQVKTLLQEIFIFYINIYCKRVAALFLPLPDLGKGGNIARATFMPKLVQLG